ncbi:MAG TPA: hypothetical protein VGM54_24335 [Chthoniobacter sp.]|jgi:hypothetical protein
MEQRIVEGGKTLSRAGIAVIAVAAVALAGCKPSPQSADSTPEGEMKDGHPVVHLAPVKTQPFDDGYNVGFEYGKEHSTAQSKAPTDEEAARVAHEQAADHPERNDHWEHGFAEGYADGVRNVVTRRR